MWCGNHIVSHNSEDKQSSKDAAAENSVTVPSCVMISAPFFAFPDRWEDDGKIVFMACSVSKVKADLYSHLSDSFHLKLSFRQVILDLVLWRWDSSEYCSIGVACKQAVCSGYGISAVDCYLKI